jgi:hypothetical protein
MILTTESHSLSKWLMNTVSSIRFVGIVITATAYALRSRPRRACRKWRRQGAEEEEEGERGSW